MHLIKQITLSSGPCLHHLGPTLRAPHISGVIRGSRSAMASTNYPGTMIRDARPGGLLAD